MKTEIASKELLRRYGIATTAPRLTTSAEEARSHVEAAGLPCALKVVSPDIVHKLAAGGVKLSVFPAEAEAAYRDIMRDCARSNPQARIEGVLVEEMVPAGLEVFIGARQDPSYGPVVLLGPGGSNVERGRRPVAALAPLRSADALIDAAFPGAFDDALEDRAALAHCLLAIAGPDGLLLREPVGELDMNPVIVSGSRAIAVDAVMAERPGEADGLGSAETVIAQRWTRLGDLRPLFDPKALAFIGASTARDKIGFRMISNLVEFGFAGQIYPIHPTATEICGLKAYPSLAAIEGEIDRAYIAVSGAQVPGVLAQCRGKGVKVAQVLSAGFSEFSNETGDLERAMLDQVAEGAMRMVGPNCIGTFSARARMPVCAPRYNPTKSGGITFFSQSGTFAGDVVRRAQVWGLPLGRALSCGNCVDLDLLDMLLYAERDPETEIVAFYMESLREPGAFFRAAGSMSKPVVVLRGAMTDQGQVAASSHTAALATDRVLWEAGLAHSGVIQVATVDELMDTLLALTAHGRHTTGSRLAIFGSGGGVSVTASDAAFRTGLVIPTLSPATQAGLQRFSVPGTSVSNPIDIPVWGLRAGGRYIFEDIINLLKSDNRVDRLVVFVEMGWVLDFLESDELGVQQLREICASIGRAQRDGAPMSLALRTSGDSYQDDFVREMRPLFLAEGVSVFPTVTRAVHAQARLASRSPR